MLFSRRKRFWSWVKQAKGSDTESSRVFYGLPGVETDIWWAGDERIVVEARVFSGIADLKNGPIVDCVPAERYVAWRLGGIEALAREEPLTILVNQADQGRFDIEYCFRNGSDPVKALFCGLIQKLCTN